MAAVEDPASEASLAAAVIGATRTVRDGIDAATDLGQNIAAEQRTSRKLIRRVFLLIVLVTVQSLVIAGMVGVVVKLSIDNHSVLAGSRKARSSLLDTTSAIAGIAKRLDDCTTPGPNPPPVTGHPCYDEGTRRTQDAIGQVVVPLQQLANSLGVTLPPPTTTTSSIPRTTGQ